MWIKGPVVALSAVGTILGSAVMARAHILTYYKGEETLDGKTVVITGANTGLGKQASLEFAELNASVIMGCRDLDKCKKALVDVVLKTGNKNIKCAELDLASMESIRKFADKIKQKKINVHILVNNAGVMAHPKAVTKDGFEMHLGVNHLGHFLLTNLLLDTLKSSAPSRIINVSSIAHHRGKINWEDVNNEKGAYDADSAYAQSKLANILFTKELARRLKNSGVYVYAVDPGISNTEICRHMGYYKSLISGPILRPLFYFFKKSPRQGVQTYLYTALNKELEDEKFSGLYFKNCKVKEVSDEAKDVVTARKLWLLSEKWTQLGA